MKYVVGIFIGLLMFVVLDSAQAWPGGVHDYACPNAELNCNIADERAFQQINPYLSVYHHLCLDNKDNCLARVTGDFYLKKYYLTGNKDFLSTASHLYQDAWTPDHWYVPRDLPWKRGELFAPKWSGEIEGESNFILKNPTPGTVYDRVIKFNGKELHINKAYLDNVKADVALRVAKESSESLDELEARVLDVRWRARIRSYKDVAVFVALLSVGVSVLYLIVWIIRRRFRVEAKLGKDFYALAILAILSIIYIIFASIVYR